MELDKIFEGMIGYLAAAEGAVAKGIDGTEPRPWMDFRDLKVFGKFDMTGLWKTFSRVAANDQYATLVGGPTTLAKDVQVVKLSADFMAGMERDMRSRQRSRIRTFVHTAATAKANSYGAGPLKRNTTGWLARALAEDETKK